LFRGKSGGCALKGPSAGPPFGKIGGGGRFGRPVGRSGGPGGVGPPKVYLSFLSLSSPLSLSPFFFLALSPFSCFGFGGVMVVLGFVVFGVGLGFGLFHLLGFVFSQRRKRDVVDYPSGSKTTFLKK
jgi:hypothetical protein